MRSSMKGITAGMMASCTTPVARHVARPQRDNLHNVVAFALSLMCAVKRIAREERRKAWSKLDGA